MDRPAGGEEKPQAAAIGRTPARRERSAWLVGAAVVAGASLALYHGLGSGLRRPPADEEAGGRNTPRSDWAGLMRDEIAFQRGLARGEQGRARAVDEMVREFGRSSVGYIQVSTDASGRLDYDDVGRGAGRTVAGILRPRDVRGAPGGIDMTNEDLESGLSSSSPGSKVSGSLPPASRAKDVAPTDIGGAQGAGAVAVRAPSASSEAGLPVAAKDDREFRVVQRGGIDGTAADVRAVDADPARVAQTLSATDVPATGTPLQVDSALRGGGGFGKVAKFSGEKPAQKTVDDIETGKANQTQLAKLTSAHVYGKQGAARPGSDAAIELGGFVFDGTKAAEQRVSGMDDVGQVGGGGNLRQGEADDLEGELQKCRESEADTHDAMRTSMDRMKEEGVELRKVVVAAHDAHFAWCQEAQRRYRSCVSECKAKCKLGGCNCEDKCGPECRKPPSGGSSPDIAAVQTAVNALKKECDSYNTKAQNAGAKCSISRVESAQYDCGGLTDGVEDEARHCTQPNRSALTPCSPCDHDADAPACGVIQ